MWRHIASNGLSLLIVALVLAVGVVMWGQRQFVGVGPMAEATFFEVERGASLTEISNNLEAEGLVSNATVFRLGAQYTDQAADLKFGNYEIPASASMEEILGILTQGAASSYRYVATLQVRVNDVELRLRERTPGTGEVEELVAFAPDEPFPEEYAQLRENDTPMAYRIAVAEGVTSWQVVQALNAAEFLTGEVEGIPEEGSLAPDTYDVARGARRADVLTRMSESQERILADAWENRVQGLPLDTPEEALILASIIEKETSVPDERRQVASVFINRLNRGMRLQTDPTVIYGITNGQGVLGRGLRQSELRRETPYNTYVIPALPPTPIANPGRASIQAALDPDLTDFIFFVADGTGGHAFSETLAEHNRNVARWRQIERERQAN